jgi:hypothetical protein
METTEKKRIVQPPNAGAVESASSVISVELSEDEEVNWLWTHFPNKQSVVTGYEIVKKDGAKTSFNIESAISEWLKASEETSERSEK